MTDIAASNALIEEANAGLRAAAHQTRQEFERTASRRIEEPNGEIEKEAARIETVERGNSTQIQQMMESVAQTRVLAAQQQAEAHRSSAETAESVQPERSALADAQGRSRESRAQRDANEEELAKGGRLLDGANNQLAQLRSRVAELRRIETRQKGFSERLWADHVVGATELEHLDAVLAQIVRRTEAKQQRSKCVSWQGENDPDRASLTV